MNSSKVCWDSRGTEYSLEFDNVLCNARSSARIPSKKASPSSGGSCRQTFSIRSRAILAAAASSHVWISCPNSAATESCWGSFFVRADGVVTGALERHATDLLLSTVDTEEDLYDSTRVWRERAMNGTLNSGNPIDDPRSTERGEP